MLLYDIRVKSPNPLYACIIVGERLNDPPHTEREVWEERGSTKYGALQISGFDPTSLNATKSFMIKPALWSR